MKKILIIGAGRSSSTLIQELAKICSVHQWLLTVADMNLALAQEKTHNKENTIAIHIDINNNEILTNLIESHDLIISMVPSDAHIIIAQKCIAFKKHMVSASYVASDIQALNKEAIAAGVIILKECGLDPGIDHMSAMKIIDELKNDSNITLTGFETFTGGLLADNNNDNPWQYKFTWNPRNVVTAGNRTVKFLQEGRYKYIPYHRLFSRTEIIHIPEHGHFEGYANRDSLEYREIYGLEDIKTLFRGTLRRPGFSKAWNVFVQLGATDDSFQMENVGEMTHRQFINSFLHYNPTDSIELKLAHYMHIEMESEIMYKLKWIGIFDDTFIGIDQGTPAQILEHILKKKWSLQAEDRDIIAMWHKFDFEQKGVKKQIQSHMVIEGIDQIHTGMSLTVGLPIAFAAKHILLGNITARGVQRPVTKSIYQHILPELEKFGIKFIETEIIV